MTLAIASDDLNLLVNGQRYGGWQEINVLRGIEIMPGSFDVALTELYPGQAGKIVIQPDQVVQVLIGSDTVLTGRVDRYAFDITPRGHQVRITGRGKCRALVDCAAGFLGPEPDQHKFQFNSTPITALVSELAAPFGIFVTNRAAGKPGMDVPIKQLIVNIGETVFEIVDRVSRYMQLLAFEDEYGNLVLDQAGATAMASGVATGSTGNVEQVSGAYACDQLYSHYYAFWTSTDSFTQERAATGGQMGALNTSVQDPGVPEFRPFAIVSEQVQDSQSFGQRRLEWEKNRRRGRSQQITVTCSTWRDGAGKLWQPNALVPVDIPDAKLVKQTWLITQVAFKRDESGTHAELVLMPRDAALPQPAALQGYDWQVGRDVQAANNGASATPQAVSRPVGKVPGSTVGSSDLSGTGGGLA